MRQASMNSLRTEQVVNLACDLATAMMAIERMSCMVDTCSDPDDRCALTVGIGSIAKHAGALADLVNAEHGGVPVVGDFNEWFHPRHLERVGRS